MSSDENRTSNCQENRLHSGAKNVSVLRDASGLVRLSPAYDVLATLPYGDQRMALHMQGRDKHLKRAHFLELGARYDIPERAMAKALDRACVAVAAADIEPIGLVAKKNRQLQAEMKRRVLDLS